MLDHLIAQENYEELHQHGDVRGLARWYARHGELRELWSLSHTMGAVIRHGETQLRLPEMVDTAGVAPIMMTKPVVAPLAWTPERAWLWAGDCAERALGAWYGDMRDLTRAMRDAWRAVGNDPRDTRRWTLIKAVWLKAHLVAGTLQDVHEPIISGSVGVDLSNRNPVGVTEAARTYRFGCKPLSWDHVRGRWKGCNEWRRRTEREKRWQAERLTEYLVREAP